MHDVCLPASHSSVRSRPRLFLTKSKPTPSRVAPSNPLRWTNLCSRVPQPSLTLVSRKPSNRNLKSKTLVFPTPARKPESPPPLLSPVPKVTPRPDPARSQFAAGFVTHALDPCPLPKTHHPQHRGTQKNPPLDLLKLWRQNTHTQHRGTSTPI